MGNGVPAAPNISAGSPTEGPQVGSRDTRSEVGFKVQGLGFRV
jgi:hypothetical protein